MQIGIDSFVAAVPDALTGENLGPADRLSHLLDEIESADRVGLDVFGIGEHHRAEFLDSAPETILAAAAVRTERIRLTSAVTVLSANDPVRIFQQFATIDLLSRGRAEMIVGRGSFVEAFLCSVWIWPITIRFLPASLNCCSRFEKTLEYIGPANIARLLRAKPCFHDRISDLCRSGSGWAVRRLRLCAPEH